MIFSKSSLIEEDDSKLNETIWEQTANWLFSVSVRNISLLPCIYFSCLPLHFCTVMLAETSSVRRRIIGSRSTTIAVETGQKNIAKYSDVGRNIDRFFVQEIKYFQQEIDKLFLPKKWWQKRDIERVCQLYLSLLHDLIFPQIFSDLSSRHVADVSLLTYK